MTLPAAHGGRFSFAGSDGWLIFADYLDWSWANALDLRGRGAGGVVISCFLLKYLDGALL